MVAPHSLEQIAEAKRQARVRAQAVRAGCDPAVGQRLAAHVLRACAPPPGAAVSGFWPMGPEIDVRPLLHELHDRGHPVLLPVTPKRGQPLTFRFWRPGDPLVAEKFGTMAPTGGPGVPAFLLVPLLAFDRGCHRLGYGGGYYDRTLAGLPGAFALGCGYAVQEVDAVPVGPDDMRLDAVATENGVIFRKDQ